MKLIIGLGNIGEKYCFTRHNIGFMVLDKWALQNNLSFKEEKKLKCYLTKFKYNNEDIILIKPTTFMNLSGEAIIAVMSYYKIPVSDILVIYDDICLDLGVLRFRGNGSDGGHNGIKSIIQHLSSKDFTRLKLGIGPQPPIPAENFVLQNFDDMEKLKEVLTNAVSAIEFYLKNDLAKAQNLFNK